MTTEIKVLIVDDSAFMRKMISQMLDTEGIRVVDTARNGQDALKKLEKFTPDVITLDVEMPKMDGLELLAWLMEQKPIPTIMLSSLTQENSNTTIRALELGAIDFISKPSGAISLDIDEIEKDLINKVKIAARSKLFAPGQLKSTKASSELAASNPTSYHDSLKKKKRVNRSRNKEDELVVIGASTGGPRALKEVITSISGDFKLGILVVQHMPPNFTKSLAERLDRLSELEVKEAEPGDIIKAGRVLLAPGGYHLLVSSRGKVELDQGEKVNNVRPAIDLTMQSAVKYYGGGVMGVVLTGMGRDGTRGLKMIKEAGGYNIAQDEATSVVYGMPKSAFEAGVVDNVKPLPLIGTEIMKSINKL